MNKVQLPLKRVHHEGLDAAVGSNQIEAEKFEEPSVHPLEEDFTTEDTEDTEEKGKRRFGIFLLRGPRLRQLESSRPIEHPSEQVPKSSTTR